MDILLHNQVIFTYEDVQVTRPWVVAPDYCTSEEARLIKECVVAPVVAHSAFYKSEDVQVTRGCVVAPRVAQPPYCTSEDVR